MGFWKKYFPAFFSESREKQEASVPEHAKELARRIAVRIYQGLAPTLEKTRISADVDTSNSTVTIVLSGTLKGEQTTIGIVRVDSIALQTKDPAITVEGFDRQYPDRYFPTEESKVVESLTSGIKHIVMLQPQFKVLSTQEIGREFLVPIRRWTKGILRHKFKDTEPYCITLIPMEYTDAWTTTPVVYIDIDVRRKNKEIRITQGGNKPMAYNATELEQALASVEGAINEYIAQTRK
jgi:hypothetical protein